MESGISQMGLALFWITAERLQMTPFTTPLYIDQLLLWIDAPSIDTSFRAKMLTLMQPFSWGLWGALVLCMVCHGVLSVWFTSAEGRFGGLNTGSERWPVCFCHRLRTGGHPTRCCACGSIPPPL